VLLATCQEVAHVGRCSSPRSSACTVIVVMGGENPRAFTLSSTTSTISYSLIVNAHTHLKSGPPIEEHFKGQDRPCFTSPRKHKFTRSFHNGKEFKAATRR
jgi:hypothetical protein